MTAFLILVEFVCVYRISIGIMRVRKLTTRQTVAIFEMRTGKNRLPELQKIQGDLDREIFVLILLVLSFCFIIYKLII